MKTKRISHADFKQELLQDPDVRKEYDDLAEEYQLIDEMLRARKRAGISQVTVAEKMHTTASIILKKYAHLAMKN